jgi:hypothetical protein
LKFEVCWRFIIPARFITQWYYDIIPGLPKDNLATSILFTALPWFLFFMSLSNTTLFNRKAHKENAGDRKGFASSLRMT